MASPADPSHPLTPPAEATQSTQAAASQSQSQPQSQSQNNNSLSNNTSTARAEVLLSQPLTSLDDSGASKRPRDHRLIHLLLASHGIQAYQERVPLQLMDFAYRYTSSVLTDAFHIQTEGYDHVEGSTNTTTTTGKGAGRKNQNKSSEEGDVSLGALRFSIGSRMGYSFAGSLPKEFLKQLADERNRVSLSTHARDGERGGAMVSGVKLPHERYCLTGVGWGLKDEWESEGEESADDDHTANGVTQNGGDSMQIDGGDGMEEDDEEGGGTMEDVFGHGSGGDGGDEVMQDS